MAITTNVLDKRRAGILLHITSLPSTLGNGTMGRQAYRFVDFLKECGLSVWQVLPIHPPQQVPLHTPHRDFLSPYQPQSVHAGNPMLIDLQMLIDKGWLPRKALPSFNNKSELKQSFEYRRVCLKEAYPYFSEHALESDHEDYQRFVEENNWWLDDYALFCVIKDFYNGACWWKWPDGHRSHYDYQKLDKDCKRFARFIERYRFIQFVFHKQWFELKEYSNQNGVFLFGDMPFFVARDSVEVWAHQDNFLLDKNGNPQYLSGISPDDDYFYFGKGQCWGHPLYNWDRLKQNNFQWWVERFYVANHLFDLTRLTYFRGFYKSWAIPADSSKPTDGKWQYTNCWEALLKTVREKQVLGNPLIWVAEDIETSKRANDLRNQYNFSRMKILQLAFNDNSKTPLRNLHLPHHHTIKDIVYTGTHDSNTTLGWLEWIKKDKNKQKHICEYLNTKSKDMLCSIIQAAFQSVAKVIIIPMQDILCLDAKHRMNVPNTSNSRNWRWQFKWSQVTPEIDEKLKRMINCYERN